MRRSPRELFGCRRLALIGLLFSAIVAGGGGVLRGAPSAGTTATVVSGSEVKAMILFNFINFTEWPSTALPEHAPFIVGVAGNRALEDELVRLADKQTVMKRRVRVIRIKTARDLEGCHVVYISATTAPGEEVGPGADELLPHLRGKPVLTVSSDPTFLRRGGIVSFYSESSGKLRFEIAPENVKSSGLVLSTKLLSYARIVTLEPGSEPSGK
jgi:hypothetical protein